MVIKLRRDFHPKKTRNYGEVKLQITKNTFGSLVIVFFKVFFILKYIKIIYFLFFKNYF
jgi:hypothetical protein